mmetsp:Transcript_68900/g.109374  ORF Transcript_68900/g.109374 Transcript_68900/m.109374 type:complete len:642 (+) Transcript_68900:67-1992(+)
MSLSNANNNNVQSKPLTANSTQSTLDEVGRSHKKEAYNHELITSEDVYVSELDTLMTHVIKPLMGNLARCHMSADEASFVFGILQHMATWHETLLRLIRDELSVVPTFAQFIGFLQMYTDYLAKYLSMLDVVAKWSDSMQFREFVVLRLQNQQCKQYIDQRLCSIPWYLYRPFERVKQYYRFFKDLETISTEHDDEMKDLRKCKSHLKVLHDKIKRKDASLIKKTRLLEIQLQLFGNPEPIVTDGRYFVYNRLCQIKQSGHLGKKYKHIHLYIFNDGLLWCSKRGQFKQQFSFKHTNLVYGIPDTSSQSESTMFIQYGSNHRKYHKKTKSKSKSKSKSKHKLKTKNKLKGISSASASAPSLHIVAENDTSSYSPYPSNIDATHHHHAQTSNEHDISLNLIEDSKTEYSLTNDTQNGHLNDHDDDNSVQLHEHHADADHDDEHEHEDAMQVEHGEATKKMVLVFVNEQARDQCLHKIKYTQQRYLRRLQREREKQRKRDKLKLSQDVNKLSAASILSSGDDLSVTMSHTDDHLYGVHAGGGMFALKPLDAHKVSNTLSRSIKDEVANDNSSNDTDMEQEREDTFSTPSSTEISSITANQHENNGSIPIIPAAPNLKVLQQSVSTEITPIKEEDEDDVKAEHD